MASWNFKRGVTLFNLAKSQRNFSCSSRVFGGHGDGKIDHAYTPKAKLEIGKREVVGFGGNGDATYYDHVNTPFPAIRFKEDAGDVLKLREKEKGDWKKMTLEEKKALYRSSYCQTYAEFTASTNDGFKVWGMTLMVVAFAFFLKFWENRNSKTQFHVKKLLFINDFFLSVYDPYPITFTKERMAAQRDRWLDMEANPISFYSANYDYEKKEWKD